MPVFSNVGELDKPKRIALRAPRVVIFGGRSLRASIYEMHLRTLMDACERLKIQEIVDVGPPIDQLRTGPLPVVRRGVLEPSQISELLSDAQLGVLSYPAAYLAKSTIFAAYAAHGVAPLLVDPLSHENEDGLAGGREYISAQARFDGECPLSAVAQAAHSWYSNHNLARSVESYVALLMNSALRQ